MLSGNNLSRELPRGLYGIIIRQMLLGLGKSLDEDGLGLTILWVISY